MVSVESGQASAHILAGAGPKYFGNPGCEGHDAVTNRNSDGWWGTLGCHLTALKKTRRFCSPEFGADNSKKDVPSPKKLSSWVKSAARSPLQTSTGNAGEQRTAHPPKLRI